MSMKYTLRFAKPDDAEKLLEIYAPFVISSERTLSDVSFEYEVPSVEEFTERIKNISAHYPYIVCEHDDRLLGLCLCPSLYAACCLSVGCRGNDLSGT